MSDEFVGEIRIFACNFAPNGWALCNGQLLPISQNTALFSLLGTTYGGNGQSNFALPDFQDMAPMHWGQGAGLTDRFVGESAGVEMLSLIQSEIPVHTHPVIVNEDLGNTSVAAGSLWAEAHRRASAVRMYAPLNASPVTMSPQAAGVAGGGLPHNNMPPYLALNFCIAMQGIFPPRG